MVSDRKIVKVFVRSSLQILKGPKTEAPAENVSQYRYFFGIGSVESYEEKLVEAQKE